MHKSIRSIDMRVGCKVRATLAFNQDGGTFESKVGMALGMGCVVLMDDIVRGVGMESSTWGRDVEGDEGGVSRSAVQSENASARYMLDDVKVERSAFSLLIIKLGVPSSQCVNSGR